MEKQGPDDPEVVDVYQRDHQVFKTFSWGVFSAYVFPVCLLLVTCLVTLWAGANQISDKPFELDLDYLVDNPSSLSAGLPYALTLLGILIIHRLGYYFLARYHNVPAVLPLFIPGAPDFTGGGFAFIRVPISTINRRALFDIGACGSLLAFLVAAIGLIIGLSLSTVGPDAFGWHLGEPLLIQLFTWLILGPIPDGFDVALHPVGFAAWYGLLTINLCLIPLARLDGAFVGKALWGTRMRMVQIACGIMLLVLGVVAWPGYLLWLVFTPIVGYFLGRRIPQINDPDGDLGAIRKKIRMGFIGNLYSYVYSVAVLY